MNRLSALYEGNMGGAKRAESHDLICETSYNRCKVLLLASPVKGYTFKEKKACFSDRMTRGRLI